MLRRLRRLLSRPAPPQAPLAPTALPVAPDSRFIDAAGLRRLPEALCVDLRPVSALRYGVVEGAWLLPSLSLLPPTKRPVVLLCADPEAATGQGWPVTWGGLASWRAAGHAIREPEWKSPLPLLHPVTVAGVAGWIQDITWSGAEFRYAVLCEDGRWLGGLTEEEIESRGARGAAGLGEQL
jgi:hypothetical protein